MDFKLASDSFEKLKELKKEWTEEHSYLINQLSKPFIDQLMAYWNHKQNISKILINSEMSDGEKIRSIKFALLTFNAELNPINVENIYKDPVFENPKNKYSFDIIVINYVEKLKEKAIVFKKVGALVSNAKLSNEQKIESIGDVLIADD